MRAKDENSSTMRPMSPTWRMIVSVHCSNTCWSVWISLAVFALEPLGGKLDRRQRVLDFMGDAAGDVGPGGVALGRDKLGDVVEGHDMAVSSSSDLSVVTRTMKFRSLSSDPHGDLAFAEPEGRASLFEHRSEVRQGVCEGSCRADPASLSPAA